MIDLRVWNSATMASVSTGIVGVETATHLACESQRNVRCGVPLVKGL